MKRLAIVLLVIGICAVFVGVTLAATPVTTKSAQTSQDAAARNFHQKARRMSVQIHVFNVIATNIVIGAKHCTP